MDNNVIEINKTYKLNSLTDGQEFFVMDTGFNRAAFGYDKEKNLPYFIVEDTKFLQVSAQLYFYVLIGDPANYAHWPGYLSPQSPDPVLISGQRCYILETLAQDELPDLSNIGNNIWELKNVQVILPNLNAPNGIAFTFDMIVRSFYAVTNQGLMTDEPLLKVEINGTKEVLTIEETE
jgi:hypothetical protein